MPKLEKGMEIAKRFVITDRLGSGANGEVWKALDKTGQRDVAIKVLINTGTNEVTRLLHEAQKWMRLEHENIVRLYDIREEDAMLIMECLEGGTLEGFIRRSILQNGGMSAVRPCSIHDARRILTDILRGLMNAHEKGILHRDLKPGNILLSAVGTAKITDFGMAREEKDGHFVTSPHMMVPGMSGTPEYMSPEVARGEDADRRSDIFAVGIIAYQLFSGRHPFNHPSLLVPVRELIAAERITAAPLGDIVPDTPEQVVEVVGKMLHKERDRRYKDIRNILIELGDDGPGLPCPSCGSGNPTSNKYCGNCGAQLGVTKPSKPIPASQDEVSMEVSETAQPEMPNASTLQDEGYELAKQGNWIGAIRKYEAATKADPKYAKAQANLAYALNHIGRYEDAVRVIDNALTLGEHHALYAYRAYSYKNMRRYREGLDDYERAIKLQDGPDSRYFKGKADCLLELGDHEQAYSTLLYALRFDPSNAWLISLKQRIEKARPEIIVVPPRKSTGLMPPGGVDRTVHARPEG